MLYVPLAAQGQCEYRLWLWRFTDRSNLCVCRNGWLHNSEVNVLRL